MEELIAALLLGVEGLTHEDGTPVDGTCSLAALHEERRQEHVAADANAYLRFVVGIDLATVDGDVAEGALIVLRNGRYIALDANGRCGDFRKPIGTEPPEQRATAPSLEPDATK